MTDIVIDAKGVSRVFGDFKAVNSLDLTIKKGQIYGFLGPNGCGKTTTIRMLTGLLTPSEGDISVLGHALPKGAEKLRLKTGYMTQKFSLYDELTVRENLAFLADIYAIDRKNKAKRIDELLETYGLTAKQHQLAGSMSGGQRQRLALAGATIHQPELLFLDEPTSAVDPENRRDFWQKLFDLSDAGTTILVSTHYMDEAERCHQLAILDAGVKKADGTPEQLMAKLNAHVVEINADNLVTIKELLGQYSEVISAAQLGIRLRVLLAKHIDEPLAWLATKLANHNVELTLARASLEDVFVVVTRK
jgi:ABC-2 type transport system ATP-binding protein